MDAKTALRFLEVRATSEAQAAEKARKNLADACAVQRSDLTNLMETAMLADAMAKPWADLMVRIERHGVREGLARMRQKAMTDLVEYGLALSTSLVTNAQRIHEQDGLRRFLSSSDLDVDEEAPAEEPAPVAEERPAPAPKSVEVPKATPAQKRTLLAIRDTRIELQETRVGHMRVVASRQGAMPRKDMVLWVIEQGWAQQDQSTSLYDGQRVSLTEVGEAILAG
ncbi:hypothetical protein [Streptomyces carpinensis]|uniref:Uncharacterized protein n=1 Tax=Streptomyces carpinensis TaxID=66369 RepID=A0ABV1W633_9ACTN|nr:hypothetical protein [Streptomyces carpinensis]